MRDVIRDRDMFRQCYRHIDNFENEDNENVTVENDDLDAEYDALKQEGLL